MRSIFCFEPNVNVQEAVEQLAQWLYDYSESHSYVNVTLEDAMDTAKAFLRQENPHKAID